MSDTDTEIRLTGPQVAAAYHSLQLHLRGIYTRPTAVSFLNRLSGRRWSAKQWLPIIEPVYLQAVAPAPTLCQPRRADDAKATGGDGSQGQRQAAGSPVAADAPA